MSARAWPEAARRSTTLGWLDDAAASALGAAGEVLTIEAGEALFRAGDALARIYVVGEGRVRAGGALAGPGDALGAEALVASPARATAVAEGRAVVAAVPVAPFERAAARAGLAGDRALAALGRAARRGLLGTFGVLAELPPSELDALVDHAATRVAARGEVLHREGEVAAELAFVAAGLVELVTERGGAVRVHGLARRGELVGDEALHGAAHATSAIAAGPTTVVTISAGVARRLAERHPDLAARARATLEEAAVAVRGPVEAAARLDARHPFRDALRVLEARSLLAIDQEACARCGHCVSACAERHDGVPRLSRRGEPVVARATFGGDEPPRARALLFPGACHHCDEPACLADCPTGAIGIGAGGEVAIRDALCTGCGACARACAWGTIRLAPRPGGAARPSEDARERAVKCDLCASDPVGPACVAACPVGAIARLDPAQALLDVGTLVRRARPAIAAVPPQPPARAIVLGGAIGGAALAIGAAVARARGAIAPGHGVGLAAGVLAATACAGLLAYAVPKRASRWLGARAPALVPLRVHATAHVALGAILVGAALAHAPWPPPLHASSGSALLVALAATSAIGALAATASRIAPRALARVERRALLPEDFGAAEGELVARLERVASGRSAVVKALFASVLGPYARTPLGPMALLASGRTPDAEARALRAAIRARLASGAAVPRDDDPRLEGLDELVTLVVDLRALRAARALGAAMRALGPSHIVTFTIVAALLLVHAAGLGGSR